MLSVNVGGMTSSSVLGRVELRSSYDASSSTATLWVGSCNDVNLNTSEELACFVRLELLKKGQCVSKQKSSVVTHKSSPTFNQEFTFNMNKFDTDTRVVASLCDHLKQPPNDVIGRLSFDAAEMMKGFDGWYTWLDKEEGRKTHKSALRPGEAADHLLVSGRNGANNVINGVYEMQPAPHGGRVAYKHKDRNLFLYYNQQNGSWLIGATLGDNAAPAYVQSNASEPHLIAETWNIASLGKFEPDPNVKVAVLGVKNQQAQLNHHHRPSVQDSLHRNSLTHGTHPLHMPDHSYDAAPPPPPPPPPSSSSELGPPPPPPPPPSDEGELGSIPPPIPLSSNTLHQQGSGLPPPPPPPPGSTSLPHVVHHGPSSSTPPQSPKVAQKPSTNIQALHSNLASDMTTSNAGSMSPLKRLLSVVATPEARAAAIKNLLDSEIYYLSNLNHVLHGYMATPQMKALLTDLQTDLIFRNIVEIHEISSSLIDRLQTRLTNNEDSVGDILEDVSGAITSAYERYSEFKKQSLQTLSSLSAKNPAFVPVIEKIASTCEDKGLFPLLELPITHAVEYPMLVKSIADSTPTTHADYPSCRQASEQLRWLTQSLDTKDEASKRSFDIMDVVVQPKVKPFEERPIHKYGRSVVHFQTIIKPPVGASGLKGMFGGRGNSIRIKSGQDAGTSINFILCTDVLILSKAENNELIAPVTPLDEVSHGEVKDQEGSLQLTLASLHSKPLIFLLKDTSEVLSLRELIEKQKKAAQSTTTRTVTKQDSKGRFRLSSKKSSRSLMSEGSLHGPRSSQGPSTITSTWEKTLDVIRSMLDACDVSNGPVGAYDRGYLQDLLSRLEKEKHIEGNFGETKTSVNTMMSEYCSFTSSKAPVIKERALHELSVQRDRLVKELAEVDSQILRVRRFGNSDGVSSLVKEANLEWAVYAQQLEAERKAREEAERKAREEAERKAREEAERKAREEAERKAREEAERKAREEAERKAREEAERKAREEAERKAREEAERKAREEAERKAREEAERKAREEAERKAREEAERKAREEAGRKAREEAERKAREEVERKAREEAERKAREEVERKAREEAERKAREEAERKAREEAERKAREEAERKAREEAERKAREEADKKSTASKPTVVEDIQSAPLGSKLVLSYNYTSKDGKVSFSKGETVTLVDKPDSNWWLVKTDAVSGLCPVTYMTVAKDSKPLEISSSAQLVRGLYAYTSQKPNDLHFKPGDIMEVLKQVDANWWLVKKVGVEGPGSQGLAPANYVKPIDSTKEPNPVTKVPSNPDVNSTSAPTPPPTTSATSTPVASTLPQTPPTTRSAPPPVASKAPVVDHQDELAKQLQKRMNKQKEEDQKQVLQPAPVEKKEEIPSEPKVEATPAAPAVTMCRALYPYDSKKGLAFAKGDTMQLVSKVDQNWWRVRLTANPAIEGLAPVNYIEVVASPPSSSTPSVSSQEPNPQPVKKTASKMKLAALTVMAANMLEMGATPLEQWSGDEEGSETTTASKAPTMVKGLFPYDSKDPNGLAFAPGDVMEVIQTVDSNWWRVKKVSGGPRSLGLAPVNYVKVLPAESSSA